MIVSALSGKIGFAVTYSDRDMDGASVHKPACVQQDDPMAMFSFSGLRQTSSLAPLHSEVATDEVVGDR